MTNTKVIFFSRPKSFKNRAVALFTGCPFYHVGFLQWDEEEVYDMYFMRRKRTLAEVQRDNDHEKMVFAIVDSPVEIPTKYFQDKILHQNEKYGFLDLLLFAVRPLYNLFGKTTRNQGGIICSEMVNNDLKAHDKYQLAWKCNHPQVDSPCDIWRHLKDCNTKVSYLFGPGISENERAYYIKLVEGRYGDGA